MISNRTNHRLTDTRNPPILCFGQRSGNAVAVEMSSTPRRCGGIFVLRVEASQTTRPPMSRNIDWETAKNGDTTRKDSVGDAMTEQRTCTICGKDIPAKRAATYRQAVLCGADSCAVKHSKLRNLTKQKRWRDKRIAADPEFRFRALRQCRKRYIARRLAAGKIVGPPASWASVRPPSGRNPPEPAWNPFTALCWPVTYFQRVLRRRRDRKTHRAWRTFLTRQGRSPDGL